MTIRTRLTIGLLLVASLVAVVGCMSWITNKSIRTDLKLLSQDSLLQLVHATDLINRLQDTQIASEISVNIIQRMAIDPNSKTSLEDLLHRYLGRIKSHLIKFETDLKKTYHNVDRTNGQNETGSPENKPSPWTKQMNHAFVSYIKLVENLIALANQDAEAANSFLTGKVTPYYRLEMLPMLQRYRQDSQDKVKTKVQAIEKVLMRANNHNLVVTLFAIVCALGISVAFAHKILRPLEQLKDAAEGISKGRTDVKADIRSQDEIGLLATAFNQMVSDLQAINTKLRREMSQRERAEEKAREHQEQLNHVTRLSTMGEMAMNLAHELNQPLGAVVTYSQSCIRSLPVDMPHNQFLAETMGKVVDQAKRASRIIQGLREFLVDQSSNMQPQDMPRIVKDTRELMMGELRRAQMNFLVEMPNPISLVLADRIQIEQVLVNLIRNAIQAIDAKSGYNQLQIRLMQHKPEEVEVSVTDSGPGCQAEMLKKMFDPYVTTKGSKTNMGMGLSICRSIMEAHGGQIHASNKDNSGLTISFTLPTVPSDN